MRLNDIESWALNVIQRVESKQPVEDSHVELKSEWPKDHNKAARQIAGHANAAHGESILWLLGVDERKGVTGVDYEEISNWKQSIEAKFEGLLPPLTHLNIPYRGKTVVALLWETERRPFLVKNPKGGTISFEVPWRDAGATSTANRTNLLKMLSPLSKSPLFEVVKGALNISLGERDSFGGIVCNGGLFLDVYIVPRSDDRVIIPYHRCEAKLKFIDSGLTVNIESVWFAFSGGGIRFPGMSPPPSMVNCTPTEIVINGAGMVTICTANPSLSLEQKSLASGDIQAEVKMRIPDEEILISIMSNLTPAETPKGALGRWVIKKLGQVSPR